MAAKAVEAQPVSPWALVVVLVIGIVIGRSSRAMAAIRRLSVSGRAEAKAAADAKAKAEQAQQVTQQVTVAQAPPSGPWPPPWRGEATLNGEDLWVDAVCCPYCNTPVEVVTDQQGRELEHCKQCEWWQVSTSALDEGRVVRTQADGRVDRWPHAW